MELKIVKCASCQEDTTCLAPYSESEQLCLSCHDSIREMREDGEL